MKPQLGSRAAVVIDGILTILRDEGDVPAEYALKDVQIVDGPAISSGATQNDVVQVAPGDPGEPAVITQRVPQPGLGRQAYLERTEVTMLISCFGGGTDMKVRRDRTVEVFDAVKACVDDHQVVGGQWDTLRLGEAEVWYQVQADDGVTVYVGFTLIAESIV